MNTRAALLVSLLSLSAPAAGAPPDAPRGLEALRDVWDRAQRERAIEANMVRAHLRGVLGPRPEAPDWAPREAEGGRLERGPGGVPLLYLEGSPEQMGRQHGLLLADEVRALRRYVQAFVGPARVPAAIERAEGLFLQHAPADLVREVTALADAAGMPRRELLFAQWFTDLYRGFACSTLNAQGARGPLLARNLDFPTLGFLGRYSLVIVARPAGKRPFVAVGWPGMVGVLSGQSASLAVTVNVVHSRGEAQPGVPFQLALRAVLEQARDVDEAEALLRRTPLTVTNNLTAVDAAGGRRVLELHPEGIVARVPAASEPLVTTNHFVTPERRQVRTSLSYLSSRRRFSAVRRAAPDAGPLSLAQARAALQAAGTPFTVQAMVFAPAEGAIHVSLPRRGDASREPFVRLGPEVLLGR